jgi:hypothetical protein
VNLERACVHEAGHFYLAYKYRPARAISICISHQLKRDVHSGQEYASVGHVITFEPEDALPKVQVSIRAAGLAAESLIYGESFEDLMNNPSVLLVIKTDTDNAKRDLQKAGLCPLTEDEFVSYWRAGFCDAVTMMCDSVEKLRSIAAYCLENLGRDIPRTELVEACNL